MAQAAAKPNFGSILDMPAAEAARPPTLPRGYYVCVVNSARIDKTANTGTEFVEYTLKVIEPYEGKVIDEAELDAFGDVAGQLISYRLWMTDKAAYRAKEFLEHCGVKIPPKASFRQLIEEARGCEVVVQVIHEPWQTGEGMSARVRSTAPVEK